MKNRENGQASNKPAYKKWWFWVTICLCALLLIGILAFVLLKGQNIPTETQTPDEKTNTVTEVTTEDLNYLEPDFSNTEETTEPEVEETTEPEVEETTEPEPEETTEPEIEETTEPEVEETTEPEVEETTEPEVEETTEPEPEETTEPEVEETTEPEVEETTEPEVEETTEPEVEETTEPEHEETTEPEIEETTEDFNELEPDFGDTEETTEQETEETSEPTETVEDPQMSLTVVYVSSPVNRNEMATLTIKGKPNTEYSIVVYYSTATGGANGLETKVSDSSGELTWTWKVGGRTKAGSHKIVITGGGEKVETQFVTN